MDLPVLKYTHAKGYSLVKYRVNGQEAIKGWFHITSRQGGKLAFQIDVKTGKMQLSTTERGFGCYKFYCAAQFSDGLWTGKRKVRITVPPVFEDIVANPFKTSRITMPEFHTLEIRPLPGWTVWNRAGERVTVLKPLIISATTNLNERLKLSFSNIASQISMYLKYNAKKRQIVVIVNSFRALVDNRTPFIITASKARPMRMPIRAVESNYIIFKRVA